MVVGTATPSTPGLEYRGMFQEYVARSTEALAGQLAGFNGLLSQEMQARVWLTLSYGLRLNWAWPATRDLLLLVAPKMEQAATWEDWLPCLARGVEKSKDVGDLEAEAELSMQLGHLLHRVGQMDAARTWLESARSLFARIRRPQREAMALGRLANLTYRAEGDYTKAREFMAKAFRLLKPKDPEGAFCYFVSGAMALDQHDLELASEHLLLARSLAEIAGDERTTALTLVNLGRVYQERGLFEPAEQYYEWAIETFSEIQDPVNLAVAQMALGAAGILCNEPAKAIVNFRRAESTLRRCHGDRRYLAMVYNNLGMAHAGLHEWVEAEEAYLAGIALWRELDKPLARLNVEDNLGEAYLRQGKTAQAIAIFRAALDELAQLEASEGQANHVAFEQLRADLSGHLQEALLADRGAGAVESQPKSESA